MVTTKERTEIRAELVGQGYSWEYIDGWQPKITLYRHREIKNGEEVVSPVGTKLENLPGNPDYVLRKSKLGLLPYPPSDTCECRWCEVRAVKIETEVKEVKEESVSEYISCQECDEEISASTKAGALSRLRAHVKSQHSA
jgi:hypothetical protein|tara:strand:+ start:6584 stop:7003 length:420 start_codon:yes stop_codon:yes gene_type:complete